MTIIVVVVAGPAPDLSRFSIDDRHDGVIGDAAAFYAMIVDDIAQSLFTHEEARQARVYQQ